MASTNIGNPGGVQGFFRTSSSRVFDRVVRVDRERLAHDGLGGDIVSYTVLMERYWIHLYPGQRKERDRTEPGRTSDRVHEAIGPKPRELFEVKIGDRFVDEKANEFYLVRQVLPGRGESGYSSGAIHYVLHEIRDGERAVVS